MFELLAFIVFLFFAGRRLLTYLHVFQQEEYDGARFCPWIFANHAFDKKLSLTLLVIGIISVVPFIGDLFDVLTLIAFLYFGYKENNPLTSAKKKLVLTDRAKRLFIISAGQIVLLSSIFTAMEHSAIGWILMVQFIPFSLPISVILVQPFENKVNRKFRDEAVDKLKQINPMIIGITGSFGKTSVKHILGHVLENYAPTLITPGSVNTEMGITRVIREQLRPDHQYFIAEMGAYGIGSIKRLCDLAPPKISMVTAIGYAHYERFKTLEDTAKAKFEIAEAALANEGSVIINSQVLELNNAETFFKKNKDHFVVCGDGYDIQAKNIKQTKDGLRFDLLHGKDKHKISIPIYGTHHVGNTLLAYATAIQIGMKPKDIVNALKTLPQIRHRLEVKDLGDLKIIDNAYNSNPSGFKASLDVLDVLAGKKSQKIIITPGIIELGDDHDSIHNELGALTAKKADIVIAVCPERIESFVFAYKKSGGKNIIRVETFEDAQKKLNEIKQTGDVVLLENDLPDLYERKLNL